MTTEGYKPIEQPAAPSAAPEPQDFIAKFKRQKEEAEKQRQFEEEQAKRRRLLAKLQQLSQGQDEPAPKRKVHIKRHALRTRYTHHTHSASPRRDPLVATFLPRDHGNMQCVHLALNARPPTTLSYYECFRF